LSATARIRPSSLRFLSPPRRRDYLEENGMIRKARHHPSAARFSPPAKAAVFVNNRPATGRVSAARPSWPGPRQRTKPASTRPSSASSSTASPASLSTPSPRPTSTGAPSEPAQRPPPGRAGPSAHGRSLELISARKSKPLILSPAKTNPWKPKARPRQRRKLYAAAMGAFDQLYEGGASAEPPLRAALRNVRGAGPLRPRFTEASSSYLARAT